MKTRDFPNYRAIYLIAVGHRAVGFVQCWVLAVFAVLGAFFACALGGAGIAYQLGIWDVPVAGFSAAFAVVSVAYISAPHRGRHFAVFVLLLGCAFAWALLEPSWYPESYPAKAYQPTHLPFVATVAGGAIALTICLFPFRSSKGARQSAPVDAEKRRS